ncbi:WD40/YVTN/BNR-like repeat-containing protein [Pseudomonas sp. DTU_2021_1001937_2_SI_NGA_ILE_001]|uniref:WD40/YVTN/BNR-like repeat-containing protein n=1 Tax=Pseudomonas sp. DTU_2021_1001937_2_SI_NGA_ILE_001 TaxID=3077589 RepID=UPI0039783C7C
MHEPTARCLRRTALWLATLLVMPFSVSLHAASDTVQADVYAIESNRAATTLLLDVAHAGPRVVAVGDHGHILYSDDQGQSWQQARVPSRQLLTAVYFVDERHGWAVGHDAQILASSDGGQTWSKQFEDQQREAPLLDVWFQDPNTGFAVGAYGALLATLDGGRHWDDVSARLDNEDQFHLNAIAAIPEAGLFIVGEAGGMYRSRDLGQSWEKLDSPYHGSLFGVIATGQPQTLLVFGLRGNLLRSSDFGDSWEAVQAQDERGALQATLAGAGRLDDGSLVLVGNAGTVLRSTDAGQNFTVFNRPDHIALAGVTGNARGELILVGQGGVRLGSSDGAALEQR